MFALVITLRLSFAIPLVEPLEKPARVDCLVFDGVYSEIEELGDTLHSVSPHSVTSLGAFHQISIRCCLVAVTDYVVTSYPTLSNSPTLDQFESSRNSCTPDLSPHPPRRSTIHYVKPLSTYKTPNGWKKHPVWRGWLQWDPSPRPWIWRKDP